MNSCKEAVVGAPRKAQPGEERQDNLEWVPITGEHRKTGSIQKDTTGEETQGKHLPTFNCYVLLRLGQIEHAWIQGVSDWSAIFILMFYAVSITFTYYCLKSAHVLY